MGSFHYSKATSLAANIINRHRHAEVGADHRNPGKYAAYFYDDERHSIRKEIRSVGGFATVGEATRAIPYIVAETIIEDVSVWEWDSHLDPEGTDA